MLHVAAMSSVFIPDSDSENLRFCFGNKSSFIERDKNIKKDRPNSGASKPFPGFSFCAGLPKYSALLLHLRDRHSDENARNSIACPIPSSLLEFFQTC